MKAEACVKHLTLVGFAVVVGVGVETDLAAVVCDDGMPIVQRKQSDGDIELIDEGGDLVGAAVVVGVFQDFDGVLEGLAGLGGEGIFVGHADPEASLGIECQVGRLADVRLGSDELDLEAGGKMKRLLLLGGRQRRGVSDIKRKRVFGGVCEGAYRQSGGKHEQRSCSLHICSHTTTRAKCSKVRSLNQSQLAMKLCPHA
jgi:hypothetical protein